MPCFNQGILVVGVTIVISNMILRTIMDRGANYKYLNSALKLDEFENKDSPYLFYEEWLKKGNLPEMFLKKYIL